jgi:hypothetical protein
MPPHPLIFIKSAFYGKVQFRFVRNYDLTLSVSLKTILASWYSGYHHHCNAGGVV